MIHSTCIERVSRLFLPLLGLLVALSACGKKSSADGSEYDSYQDIEQTFDDSEPAAAERQPVEGAKLEGLSEADVQRFEKVVDRLPSPCGKAHSLRTSRNTDAECVRAPFAVEYVVALIGDGATDEQVQELYELRYGEKALERHGFKLDASMPHKGPTDAPVVLVEFFDYGCPACARIKPLLDETVKSYPRDVVLYYKMYPLASHPNSTAAAQAALAAAKQGKFEEMHALLFENQHSHSEADLRSYAEKLGLDMQKFKSDFDAASAAVKADKKEGDEAGVMGTPTLYVNGSLWQGPEEPKYLKMWVEEQLALTR